MARAFIIAGMHRSGTSASTRVISLLGAELPSKLMPASEEYNATGFWESVDITNLNDQLMMSVDSRWDDVLPIDFDMLPYKARQQLYRKAIRLFDRDFARAQTYVIKDPRIARILPCWTSLIKRRGDSPLVVIPFRHPLEVAKSLEWRDGFPLAKGIHLWVRHIVDSIRYSAKLPRAFFSYDDLLSDWQRVMTQVAQDLQIEWAIPITDVQAQVDGFLDVGYRHHQARNHTLAKSGEIGRMADELYHAMLVQDGGLMKLATRLHNRLEKLVVPCRDVLHDACARLNESELHDKRQQAELALCQQGLDEAERSLSQNVAERDHARQAHAELTQAFEEKARHVEALAREVGELRAQQVKALDQLSEYESTLETERQTQAEQVKAYEEELRAQQVKALEQLSEYESTLETERQTQAEQVKAFEEKARHVEVLSREVEELRAQQVKALEQLSEYESTLETERQTQAEQVKAFEEELRAQQVKALDQLSEYESTLKTERQTQAEQVKAFEEKARHVEVLSREVEELRAQQAKALEQLAEYESSLEKERQVQAEQMKAVEEKARHVEVLSSEAKELRAQLSATLAERTELEQLLLTVSASIDRVNEIVSDARRHTNTIKPLNNQ